MSQALKQALDGLDAVSRWAIVSCMIVMIGVVSTQVLLRYAFSYSLDWAEEVSRLTFVWSVFMAVAHGVKLSAHVGIDVVARRFPAWLQRALQPAVRLVSGLLMSIVAVQAALVAGDSWDQMMPTLDLSTGWFYLAVTVGCAHSALHLFDQLLRCAAPAAAVEEAA
ncbi:TRAP transporter small permease [Thauera sp. SDU_THAU2]|uniref:TRAP transporter small permease n=1 Tax=Thauera sp. SDU_THAU2 TaxID=3136633 RepID=UPI00311F7037